MYNPLETSLWQWRTGGDVSFLDFWSIAWSAWLPTTIKWAVALIYSAAAVLNEWDPVLQCPTYVSLTIIEFH